MLVIQKCGHNSHFNSQTDTLCLREFASRGRVLVLGLLNMLTTLLSIVLVLVIAPYYFYLCQWRIEEGQWGDLGGAMTNHTNQTNDLSADQWSTRNHEISQKSFGEILRRNFMKWHDFSDTSSTLNPKPNIFVNLVVEAAKVHVIRYNIVPSYISHSHWPPKV